MPNIRKTAIGLVLFLLLFTAGATAQNPDLPGQVLDAILADHEQRIGALEEAVFPTTTEPPPTTTEPPPTTTEPPPTTTEPPPTTTEDPDPPTQPNIVLVDQGWTCTGFQDRALVSITLTASASDGMEAINHREDCHGEIDRVEITAVKGHDMLDFNNATNDVHDLHYGGGFVRARGASSGAHQDCIQFTNGVDARNVLIEDVVFSGCDTQYIITSTSVGTNVVCDGCTFLPEHNGLVPTHTQVNGGPANAMILVGGNIGTRNSLVCIGSRFNHGVRVDANPNAIGWVESGAVGGYDAQPAPGSGNELATLADPRCNAPG